jgi:hypothetical protein
MDIDFQTGFNKTDDRRNKRYSKSVTVRVVMPALEGEHDDYKGGWLLNDLLKSKSRKEYGLDSKDIKISIDRGGYYSRGDMCHIVTFKRGLKAEKPSSIASDEEARRALPSEDMLKNYLESMWDEAQQKLNAQIQNKKDFDLAAHLLGWTKKEAEKRAKKVCRFEQRLQALVAEFKAETLEQSESVIKETLKEAPKELEENGYNAEVEKTYKAFAADFIKENLDDGLPGGFFSRSNRELSNNWLEKKTKESNAS